MFYQLGKPPRWTKVGLKPHSRLRPTRRWKSFNKLQLPSGGFANLEAQRHKKAVLHLALSWAFTSALAATASVQGTQAWSSPGTGGMGKQPAGLPRATAGSSVSPSHSQPPRAVQGHSNSWSHQERAFLSRRGAPLAAAPCCPTHSHRPCELRSLLQPCCHARLHPHLPCSALQLFWWLLPSLCS